MVSITEKKLCLTHTWTSNNIYIECNLKDQMEEAQIYKTFLMAQHPVHILVHNFLLKNISIA